MGISNWRTMIGQELSARGETWEDVESNTLTEAELDEMFDRGYGSSNGKPFTLWTHKRVYFPVVYDGAEWVESVSRNPDDVPTVHVGGQ